MKGGLTDVLVERVLSWVKALGHFHGFKGHMINRRRTAFTNRGCSVVGDLYRDLPTLNVLTKYAFPHPRMSKSIIASSDRCCGQRNKLVTFINVGERNQPPTRGYTEPEFSPLYQNI
jgi:hypothetical protein